MGRVTAEWGLGAQSLFWLGEPAGTVPSADSTWGFPCSLLSSEPVSKGGLCRSRFEAASSRTVLGEDPGATRFADGALTWMVAGLIAAAHGTSPSVFPRVTPAGAVPDAQARAVDEGLLCVQDMVTGRKRSYKPWISGLCFMGSQFGQVFPLGSELASVGTEVPSHLSVPWSSEVLGTGCF